MGVLVVINEVRYNTLDIQFDPFYYWGKDETSCSWRVGVDR